MQFNYETILILLIFSVLIVIILVKFIYRHNPQYDKEYGKDIVLFHREERYRKRVWIFNIIEEMKKLRSKGSIDNLELRVIVGEFSEDTQEIIKHAANHKFESIIVIGGPKVFCEDRMEIYNLLDNYDTVKYSILSKRPTKHFMIFDKFHLYIEKPHRHDESRGSVGLKKAQPKLIQTYEHAFYRMLEYSRPLTKEEILNLDCY